jgi:hypothetical protein
MMHPIEQRSSSNLTAFSANPEVYRQVSTVQPSHDQMTSHSDSSEIKITGFELIAKSAIALTLGVAPFFVSKSGEWIVKGYATVAERMGNFFNDFGTAGRFLANSSRVALGIPACLGGILLFGGAVIFSKAQQIVWGKFLIENPQEERINTQLARYGAGSKPWNDFCTLLSAFFAPSFSQETRDHLSHLRDFKAT